MDERISGVCRSSAGRAWVKCLGIDAGSPRLRWVLPLFMVAACSTDSPEHAELYEELAGVYAATITTDIRMDNDGLLDSYATRNGYISVVPRGTWTWRLTVPEWPCSIELDSNVDSVTGAFHMEVDSESSDVCERDAGELLQTIRLQGRTLPSGNFESEGDGLVHFLFSGSIVYKRTDGEIFEDGSLEQRGQVELEIVGSRL